MKFFAKIWKKLLVLLVALGGVFAAFVFRADLLEGGISFFSGDFLVQEDEENKSGIKRAAQGTYLEEVKRAERLMEAGYYEKAREALLSALRQKPDYILSYVRLGELYAKTGDRDKLAALIVRASEKFAGNLQLAMLELRLVLEEGNYDRAMEILAQNSEGFLDLKFYEGVLFALQNRHEEAKKIFIDLESAKTQVLSSLSDAKDLDAARVSQRIAAQASAFSIAYEEFSEFSEGKNAHLFAKLAKILVENDEAKLGEVFAERAIDEDVKYPDGWILRGYARYLQKDFEGSLTDFRAAYELDTIRAEVAYFMALALTETGNLDEAVLFFEKALTYDFDFSEEVKWKLLSIFGKQQRYDRMLEIYQELLASSDKVSENPKEFTQAVYTAIDLLKKPELALEITEKLLAKNSGDVFVMNIHAWALIANERYFDAEKVLEKALKISPKNPRTYLNLGLMWEAKEDYTKAKNFYQQTYLLGKGVAGYEEIVNLGAEHYNDLLEREKQGILEEKLGGHSP